MDWKFGRAVGLAFTLAAAGCAGVPQPDSGAPGTRSQGGASTGWDRVTLRPPFEKTLMVGARFPLGSENPEEGLGFKASFVHGVDDEGRGWTCPGIIDPVSGKAMTVTDFEARIGPNAARRLPTLDGFDCDPDKAGGPALGQS